MELLIWLTVFVASLVALVRGADWFLESAEKIGLSFGLSHFVVGVLIVGFGTSLPELISSIAAVFQNVTEIVPANAAGSNIANILLVVGISAVIAGRLEVVKDLVDSELPMLALATMLFVLAVYDGVVSMPEAAILLVAYAVYIYYNLNGGGGDGFDEKATIVEKITRPSLVPRDLLLLLLGGIALSLGAKFLIDALIAISTILSLAPSVISITAVAIGTSLPELFVSIKAARAGKSDVAIGNIFGSNVFNALVVIGIPGLLSPLVVDEQTLKIGVPMMVLATLALILSGISRRIYAWEGLMFLILYLFFTLKLFNVL